MGKVKPIFFGTHKSKAKKQALSNAKRDVLLQDLENVIGAKKIKENFFFIFL